MNDHASVCSALSNISLGATSHWREWSNSLMMTKLFACKSRKYTSPTQKDLLLVVNIAQFRYYLKICLSASRLKGIELITEQSCAHEQQSTDFRIELILDCFQNLRKS